MIDESVLNEQIAEKMQELNNYLKTVVDAQIKPLMYMQTWYMERMKALGYPINMNGECYGFSHMAIQAFFANDMDTFDKRLQTIYDSPLEDFKNDFAKLRAEKQRFIEIGQAVDAKKIEEKITDFYAFFDGVALNQAPFNYLYNEENQPLSKKQDVRKTMPITMPVALETNENTPTLIATFVNFTNHQILFNCLDMLKRHLGKHSFALNLIAVNHAITLTWNPETDCWSLIDPNHLPGQEYVCLEQLVIDLFNYYSLIERRNSHFMGTSIFTATQYEETMRREFEQLQTNPEWLQTNKPSLATELKNWENTYYHNDDSTKWNDRDVLEHALRSGLTDVLTTLVHTKDATFFKNLENEKVITLLDTIPTQHLHVLIEKISTHIKNKIIQKLLAQGESSQDIFFKFFNLLPKQEQLTNFLNFPREFQCICLQELSMEQRNNLFLHLPSMKKIEIISMASNLSDLQKMLHDEECIQDFAKLGV